MYHPGIHESIHIKCPGNATVTIKQGTKRHPSQVVVPTKKGTIALRMATRALLAKGIFRNLGCNASAEILDNRAIDP
jgi:hypothetical protein